MKRTLRDLLRATGGELISGSPVATFEGVSIDTRTVKAGNLFFAIKGPRFDGHAFLKAASERGAAALVVDRLPETFDWEAEAAADVVLVKDTLAALQQFGHFCRLQSKAVVIGITGSNGKTTTKEMLASICRLAGKTLSTRGNFNNHIGLPLMLTELEPEHAFAVMELGTSKKGDMDVLIDILEPQIGLITNVGKDHLEFLGTPEGVLNENRALYDRLPPGGTAIVNLDDPLLAGITASLPGRVVTFGFSNAALVRADSVRPWPLPLSFQLFHPEGTVQASIELPGRFQVSNALAAAATALSIGISEARVVQGLATFRPAAMRMQVSTRPDGAVLINDAYNANPSSVQASIAGFCEMYPDRPRWVVLGDMRELGAIARDEHRELGRWLARQPLSRIFLYGRDTRFMLEGLSQSGSTIAVERFQKKRYLIEALERQLPNTRPAVLFKASRSLKLEDVIAPLAATASAGAAAAH